MSDVSTLKVNSTVYTIKDGVARANLDNKLDKYQGVEYAGRILKIDENGNIKPSTGSSTVNFSDIGGDPLDNTNLAAALAGKVNLAEGSQSFSLGLDSTGSYVLY